ncbi:MAG: pyruvate phosphate dikinase, pyruvate,orthophosphate dikinase [Candidatus Peregrinibacteria bacterium GW2011_GWC2_39_14]|nr:MAG: Pyruvate phosphate dikinase [Candidatus Peregrinibacteria bacterium GW2011_GWA2_38_36]KKR05241.1 MAG: pyruvate phosphate dikinase, pyruvate,orthophosphate dikinase [Candidatus Peregrinibacteria bacterium GW2011_GWC2_39_14]
MTNTQDTTSMKAASVSSTKNLTKHEHTMTNSKMIYAFEEGNKDMKTLLGGKGANLAEMTNLGLPVPPGFTITTDMCNYYLENNSLPETFDAMLNERIAELEAKLGKKFGDIKNPLLVSVRSGAAISMPGMMDTILNLGLNDEAVEGLALKTQNPRFSYDSYRRFIQMFSDVVLGVDHEHFEEEIDKIKRAKGVKLDTELTAEDLKNLIVEYKKVIKSHIGTDFPQEPLKQMKLAIEAVFKSWNNSRAIHYRRINRVTNIKGTAVNIQAMVFGNMGDTSGTGVCFTRNPATGEKKFYGEFLMNAQGEDVVAGIRTPQSIDQLAEVMPKSYAQLLEIQAKLEKHYRDMQDMEFTIEDGRLFILQTRNGKRTAQAAIRIASEMIKEGVISEDEAVMRIDPYILDSLLHPTIDPKAKKNVVAKGLPASPGACTGKVVFSADDAVIWTNKKEKVILVRKETTPEDIHGMNVAEGILTSMGGMTSHAALVCRGMGKPCVAGCSAISVDKNTKTVKIGDVVVNEGEIISLDGATGSVILGEVAMVKAGVSGDFGIIMGFADRERKLRVRTNVDTPFDAKVAMDFGAEGVGLCRTEHMFFQEGRIDNVREMIMSKSEEGRRKALAKLLPYQREDFVGIFEVMTGLPVTVRLLDPPLHEFLPEKEAKIRELSERMNVSFDDLMSVISSLHEINPMLGHRGCRLGITYPEIYEMQAQAIIEAGIEASRKGAVVKVEIEIPLVANLNEFKAMKELVLNVIAKYKDAITFDYKIGTMIELPRACLIADKLAEIADFFSFGTNDLTQTTYGISRDDVGKFMGAYIDKGIFERDPSESIDKEGVGELMKMAVNKARSVKPGIDIGICGEHGGDPDSVKFCHEIGLNYVSCSPYRVPIARLSAGQASIKDKGVKASSTT